MCLMNTLHMKAGQTKFGCSEALWFVFRGDKMLMEQNDSWIAVPQTNILGKLGLSTSYERAIGDLDGIPCFVACLSDEIPIPFGINFHGLRSIYSRISENMFRMALRALSIINWDNTHRFCGCCGVLVERRTDIIAQQCPGCGFVIFPRISPAVIVLVERGEEILLARASRFKDCLYSVIAGFVEPGESLEDTVKREVKEEAGIEIRNIRYFGSQPWPFPDSLMIGFTAEYAGGEIRVDGEELVEAAWFTVDELPEIPGKISIARALIDGFVLKHSP